MKKLFKIAPAIALAAAAAMPGRASASGPYYLSGTCSAGAAVCTSARFWLSGSTLMFDIFNGASLTTTALQNSRISGLAIFGMPTGVTGSFLSATFYDYNGTTQSAISETTKWKSGVLPPLQNLADKDAAFETVAAGAGIGTCNASGGGPLWDTCQGGNAFSSTSDYMEFAIGLSGSGMTAADLSNLGYGWKAQSVTPGGNSVECSTSPADATKGLYCEDIPDGPIGITSVVTPEPATMTLMASGLVALAGVGRRRRKQQG